jgi:hypothetical protein
MWDGKRTRQSLGEMLGPFQMLLSCAAVCAQLRCPLQWKKAWCEKRCREYRIGNRLEGGRR